VYFVTKKVVGVFVRFRAASVYEYLPEAVVLCMGRLHLLGTDV
jgi:hypothetical protein